MKIQVCSVGSSELGRVAEQRSRPARLEQERLIAQMVEALVAEAEKTLVRAA